MKKQIAILATIITASGMSAFGQGYFNFSSGGGYVYDEFTTPGTGVKAPADVDVAFLWNTSASATDPLGAGVATTGVTGAPGTPAASIETAISSDGWNIAYNYVGDTELVSSVNASGPTQGGISKGVVQVNSAAAAGPYDLIVIAWNSSSGDSTLEEALGEVGGFTAAADIGWSSAFDYTASTSSSSSPSQFSSQGLSPFGVAATPEPTTLALAGLGGLSMLFLRRRKA